MKKMTMIGAALVALALAVPSGMALSTTHNQTSQDSLASGDSLHLWNSIWAPLGTSNVLNTFVSEPFGVSTAGVLVTDIIYDGAVCPGDGEVKKTGCGAQNNGLSTQPWFQNSTAGPGQTPTVLVAGECEALVNHDPSTGLWEGSTGVHVDGSALFYPESTLYWNMGVLSFTDANVPMVLLETVSGTEQLGRSWASVFTYEGVGTANEVHYTSSLSSHNCSSFAVPLSDTCSFGAVCTDLRPVVDMTFATANHVVDFKDPLVTVKDHTVYTI